MCPSVALSWSIFLSVCLCCCFSMLQSLCLLPSFCLLPSLCLLLSVSLLLSPSVSISMSVCYFPCRCLSLSMFGSESSKTVFPSCGLGVLFIVWEKLYEIRKQPRGQEREKTSMRCCCLRGTHTHTHRKIDMKVCCYLILQDKLFKSTLGSSVAELQRLGASKSPGASTSCEASKSRGEKEHDICQYFHTISITTYTYIFICSAIIQFDRPQR